MNCRVCKRDFIFSARECFEEALRVLQPLLEHGGLVTRWHMYRDEHEESGVPIPTLAKGDDIAALNLQGVLVNGLAATHGICEDCYEVACARNFDEQDGADLAVDDFVRRLRHPGYEHEIGAESRRRLLKREDRKQQDGAHE